MLFIQYDGKEIPFDTRMADTEYLAFLERIQVERELAIKKRNERITVVSTVLGVVVGLAAAGAAFWAGYEAHKTRVEDERPYVMTGFGGMDDETFITGRTAIGKRPAPHVTLSVFGKSPAVNIEMYAHCSVDNSEEPTPTFDWKRPIESEPAIFPGKSKTYYCKEIMNIPQTESPPPVRFQGRIEYHDLSKHLYKTPFCFLYYAGSQITDTCVADAPD